VSFEATSVVNNAAVEPVVYKTNTWRYNWHKESDDIIEKYR